jgi:hypothetical protein
VRTVRTIAFVTTAPLALAVVGLFHPLVLNRATAGMWRDMHIWLLPVFPLVALGFVVPLWGRPRRDLSGVATVLAWLAAFGYACYYTGLDAVAGIGAGTAAVSAPPGQDLGPLVTPLFHTGDELGHWGAYAFIAASIATSVALGVRHGPRVLVPGLLLIAAGYSFVTSHIFRPRGVITMFAFAIGFALLAWLTATRPAASMPTTRPLGISKPATGVAESG